MSENREAYEGLLTHPGWKLFCEEIKAEWRLKCEQGHRNALGDRDDVQALNRLRQIQAASDAVNWALEQPSRRIAQLKEQTAEQSPLRRQEIDRLVGAMSRRGGL